MFFWSVAAATAVAICLVATQQERPRMAGLAKMTASTSFVAAAIVWGALESSYGQIVLAALAFCWLGDLALASPQRRHFMVGIGVFLAGHVAYIVAFWQWSPHPSRVASAAVPLALVAAVVARWLWRHAGRLGLAVLAYILVISAMMAVAAAVAGAVALGAALFYVSDLFVARHRFVRPVFANRAMGLPLYYAGQFVLAGTV